MTDNGSTFCDWDDYSGAAVDPVTQGFWFFGMCGASAAPTTARTSVPISGERSF